MYFPSFDQPDADLGSSDLKQKLLLARALRRLLVEVECPAAAVRAEDDRRAVRRPDGAIVVSRPEREPRVDAAREVADPDVPLGVARVRQVEGEAVARRGQRRVRVVARVTQRVEFSSRPVAPEQPPSRLAGAVGEDAVVRDREAGEPHVVGADLLGERHGLPRDFPRARVEGLSDECPVAHEEEVAGRRVLDKGLGRRQLRLLLGVDRADPVRGVLRLLAGHEVEIVLGVREKLRPADRRLLLRRVECHGGGPGASRRRDAVERIVARAVPQDDPLGAPRSVRAAGGVADLGGRSAGDVDLLHHALGDERDVAAVGRPERTRAALRAHEGLRREGVQRPDPDARLPLQVGRVEGEQAPVGRDARHVHRRDLGRRRDVEAHERRGLRRAAHDTRPRARPRRGGSRRAAPRPASRGSCDARRPGRAVRPASLPPRSTEAAASRRAPCASAARAPWRGSP